MAEELTDDVVIIGGGQAGLALGFWLRRRKVSFRILDAGSAAGGAWRHTWDGLRLFSPGHWSSLPGWLFPSTSNHYPTRDEIINYLTRYETRYQLPVERPIRVRAVHKVSGRFRIETDQGEYRSTAVASATGTWSHPYLPDYPGLDSYKGLQLHSANYVRPESFTGQRVLIVGGGNSAAQILADVSTVAATVWVTLKEPVFLPDNVDGRVLFERATERWKASLEHREPKTPHGAFGDIVMVPVVKNARDRGVLASRRPMLGFTPQGVVWPDGETEHFDVVIWCTGFRPALEHLEPLKLVIQHGRIATDDTRSLDCPGLWLLGYGDWTGPASATLIGVGRTARAAANEITDYLAASGYSGPVSPPESIS